MVRLHETLVQRDGGRGKKVYERDVEETICMKRHGLGLVDAIMINMENVHAYRNRSRGQDIHHKGEMLIV